MLVVLTKVAVIFAMVAVGFVASRTGAIQKEATPHLVSLILAVTNPCLIIASMAPRTFTNETLRQTLEVILGSVGYFAISMVLAYILVKVMKYRPALDQGILMVVITSINTGFMGFPITKAIFGDDYFFLMVMENIVLSFYLYSASIVQMNIGHPRDSHILSSLKALLNPSMISVVIGFALMLIPTKLPKSVLEFLGTLGDATIPVSMVVVGLQLGQSHIGRMLKNYKLLIACLHNVITMPLLTYFAVKLLPLTIEAKVILVFAAAFPAAVITVAMATKENKNSGLMAEGVALTTLLSVFTVPLWAMFINEFMI